VKRTAQATVVQVQVQSYISSSICEHQWPQRSRCNNVAAAASASTSGRGAGVNNGGAAASVTPADQFPYHVVVHSEAYSLLMIWFQRHKHSS